MGEVGETDRHYGGNRARPAYPWQCPNCNANNIGRVEDGCPACLANKDGKVVGIPKVVKRRAALAPERATSLRVAATPLAAGPAVPLATIATHDFQALVDAAVLVLQYVQPITEYEIMIMGKLQGAVRPFLPQPPVTMMGSVSGQPAAAAPEPAPVLDPVQLNSQLLDPRTILTIAAALDHFAEQVLAVAASPDFLSENEAVGLAEQLRASLPEDLDQVLSDTQPIEQEPEA